MVAPESTESLTKAPKTIEQWMATAEGAIARVLPNLGVSPTRFGQMVVSAVKSTPELAKCYPVTIAIAAVQAAAVGLMPNTPLGQASLIPRWNGRAKRLEANFQIEYKGWLQLLIRSGEVEGPSWSIVYANEPFRWSPASREKITHEPIEDETARGAKRGAYFICWFTGRAVPYALYLPKAKILEIRDKYSDNYRRAVEAVAKNPADAWRLEKTPWVRDEEWMWLKTVIIQAVKRAPLATEAGQVVIAAAARQEMQDAGKMGDLAAEFFAAEDLDGVIDVDVEDDGEPAPIEQPREAAPPNTAQAFADARAEWPSEARTAWASKHHGLNSAPCTGPGCEVCGWPDVAPHSFRPTKPGAHACAGDGCGMHQGYHARRWAPKGGQA